MKKRPNSTYDAKKVDLLPAAIASHIHALHKRIAYVRDIAEEIEQEIGNEKLNSTKDFTVFKKEIRDSIKTLDDAFEDLSEQADSLSIHIDSLGDDVDEVKKAKKLLESFFKKIQDEIEPELTLLRKDLESKEKNSQALFNEKLKLYSTDIASLRQSDSLLSKRIKKEISLVEKDIKSLRKEIYSFGSQVQLLQNSSFIGQSGQINFKNGTGTTVSVSANQQGSIDVSVNVSSGGYQQPTSGNVDGTNKIFKFATAPSVLVVDNQRIIQNKNSDGTVNWTGTTTITLTVAPNFDLFGIE